jgi:hypothetical protein
MLGAHPLSCGSVQQLERWYCAAWRDRKQHRVSVRAHRHRLVLRPPPPQLLLLLLLQQLLLARRGRMERAGATFAAIEHEHPQFPR